MEDDRVGRWSPPSPCSRRAACRRAAPSPSRRRSHHHRGEEVRRLLVQPQQPVEHVLAVDEHRRLSDGPRTKTSSRTSNAWRRSSDVWRPWRSASPQKAQDGHFVLLDECRVAQRQQVGQQLAEDVELAVIDELEHPPHAVHPIVLLGQLRCHVAHRRLRARQDRAEITPLLPRRRDGARGGGGGAAVSDAQRPRGSRAMCSTSSTTTGEPRPGGAPAPRRFPCTARTPAPPPSSCRGRGATGCP